MANEIPNSYHAAVRVDGTETPPFLSVAHGVSGVVRNGVGDYVVTVVEPIAVADCVVESALHGVTAGTIQVRQLTDTTFRVLTADVGPVGAADRQFSVNLFRLPTVS